MSAPVPPLAHLLRRLAPDCGPMPDADLLRRYAEHRDEAAFELLLWRHGAMMWGVCRRVAADRAAAEDAFQAAALALARHAGSIRRSASVAGWLYRVAYRAALRTHPRSVEAIPTEQPGHEPDPAEAAATRELVGVIDAEVSRLPEPFRLTLVLCDLEGQSNADAAAALGCPVGTIESRLTRARQRLRDQLSRRGVTLSAGALAVGAVPARVHAAGVRAATDPASVPPPVSQLAANAVGGARPGLLAATGLALVAGVALAAGLVAATRPDPPVEPLAQPKAAEPAKPADNVIVRRFGSDRFRHAGVVFHSAFSADGKKLATAALGSVSVWETATGKLLHRVEKANVPFHRIAFTPDGKALYVVVGPLQGGCDLLTIDPATGKELAKTEVRNAVYRSAEFSPDAARLAVFSLQPIEAVLIDPKAGKELVRVKTYYSGNTFTEDGKSLVLAGGEKTVRVVDATTGKEVAKVDSNDLRPQWVRFLTRTDVLFAGHNSVERYDLEKKKSLWTTDGFLPSGIGVEVSPDGERVAHVSHYAVTLFDNETGKELIPRLARIGGTSAKFSPDSKTLAITTPSGTVALLDARTGATRAQSPDLLGTVSNLTFTMDGRHLQLMAVSSAQGIVGDQWVRWDLSAGEPRAEPLGKFVTLSPDGRVGMRPDTFNRGDTPAEFVDPIMGKLIARLKPEETGHTVVISRADYRRGFFSGDGKRFVGFRLTPRNAGGGQKELGLATWDTATGKRLTQRDPEKAEKERLFPQAVSPDGKAVVVSFADGMKVRLGMWEPDTDTMRWTRERGTGELFAAFTSDGKKLVVQEFYTNRLIDGPMLPIPPGPYPFLTLDAATGKELSKATGPNLGEQPLVFTGEWPSPVVNARAITTDGKTLAISGWDGTVHVWDPTTDRLLAKFAHPGPVHDLAFSLDGKALAAASQAAPVLLYDVAGVRAAPKRE